MRKNGGSGGAAGTNDKVLEKSLATKQLTIGPSTGSFSFSPHHDLRKNKQHVETRIKLNLIKLN
jgi:hypothetical protein